MLDFWQKFAKLAVLGYPLGSSEEVFARDFRKIARKSVSRM